MNAFNVYRYYSIQERTCFEEPERRPGCARLEARLREDAVGARTPPTDDKLGTCCSHSSRLSAKPGKKERTAAYSPW